MSNKRAKRITGGTRPPSTGTILQRTAESGRSITTSPISGHLKHTATSAPTTPYQSTTESTSSSTNAEIIRGEVLTINKAVCEDRVAFCHVQYCDVSIVANMCKETCGHCEAEDSSEYSS